MKSSPTPAITGPPTRSTVRMLECWADCNLFSFIPPLRCAEHRATFHQPPVEPLT